MAEPTRAAAAHADAGALDAYLAALDAALAALPAAERREILLETRSHVVERTVRPPRRPVDAVLAELGAPAAYARRFLAVEPGDAPPHAPQHAPQHAPPHARADEARGSARGVGTFDALARLTAGGWRAVPVLLVVGVAYFVAGLAVLFAVAELVAPANTDVFVRVGVGSGELDVLALINASPRERAGRRELFGRAFLPFCLLLVVVLHLGVRALARAAARRLAPRTPGLGS